jgi:signal transduction histidine kinase
MILFWIESSHIESLYRANSNSLLAAIQTGDLIELNRSLSGYQNDNLVYSYELLDRDGNSVQAHRNANNPIFIFRKDLKVMSTNGTQWGIIHIFWTMQWSLIMYFILGAIAVVFTVTIIVFKAWKKFTHQLIRSIEQMKDFLTQKDVPHFIEEIDEFRLVFENIQMLQRKEIEAEKLKATIENEKGIVMLSQKVAHDLRSPMSALSLVLGVTKLDGERKSLVDSALNRMNEICNDLLDQRRSTLSNETVISAIQKVGQEVQLRYSDKILVLAGDIPDEEMIPDSEFKSVLSNLLNNAFESLTGMPAGIVKLKSNKVDNSIQIKIVDNGCGIPKSVLNNLGKLQISHGKGKLGNGLGFYNAKSWALQKGGSLNVTSIEGEGTEVTLAFPSVKLFSSPCA